MYTVVKYSNWMNQLNFSCFTTTDFNLFFALCVKAREKNTDIVELSYDELKKLTNYKSTSTKRFADDITRMNKKLLSISCMIDVKPGVLMQFNLFSTFWNDTKNHTLTVRVNPDFLFVLNDILSNYTKFDLPIFVSLESKYSKELFKHFKQWVSVGKVTFSVEDLRRKLGAPVSYTNGKFYQLILEPSINELRTKGCFKNLKCTINYSKQPGRPVKSYTFTWVKPIVDEPKQRSHTSVAMPIEDYVNSSCVKDCVEIPLCEQISIESNLGVDNFF